MTKLSYSLTVRMPLESIALKNLDHYAKDRNVNKSDLIRRMCEAMPLYIDRICPRFTAPVQRDALGNETL